MEENKLFDKTRIITENPRDEVFMKMALLELEHFFSLYKRKYGEESFKELNIDIRVMHRQGNRKEFEIKFDLFTDFGIFSSKKTSWRQFTGFRKALAAVKKQMLE